MKRLNTFQRLLAEKNHCLIYSFMRSKKLDIEEYYGDIAEAYCNAITSYSPEKGTLSSYVYYCLNNKLKNIRKAESAAKIISIHLVVSFDQPINDSDDDSNLYDSLPDPLADVESQAMLNLAVKRLFLELNKEELLLLKGIINQENLFNSSHAGSMSQSTYSRRARAVKEKAKRIIRGID